MSMGINVNTLAVSAPEGGEIVMVQPGHNAPIHILLYTENFRGVDLPHGADTIPPEVLAGMIKTYVDQKRVELAGQRVASAPMVDSPACEGA